MICIKRTHIILLIVTAILALSSAYSLAAINQVYKIDYEWYSQMNSRFQNVIRNTSRDICNISTDKLNIKASIYSSTEDILKLKKDYPKLTNDDFSTNATDDIFMLCSLGRVSSPEYRIKIASIAQRGNNIEVKVSINTPSTEVDTSEESAKDIIYNPLDLVKINKDALPAKGRIYVIFKSQEGIKIYQKYISID